MTLEEWRRIKAQEESQADRSGTEHRCIHCGAPAPAPQAGYEASLCDACD